MQIHIGGDVSKGYADFCFTDQTGTILCEHRLDDTAPGHQRMRQLITDFTEVYPDASFVAGVEATGGLELNWLSLFESLGEEEDLVAYQVNPFVLKRFSEQTLHASKTDVSSARMVARYLGAGPRSEALPYQSDKARMGLRTLVRRTLNMIEQSSQLKSELQMLLQRAHPELIQYCRSHLPQWLLKLIQGYPTPAQLAAASAEEVASIPYVTKKRAARLIRAAQGSVATQQDEATGWALQTLAEDLLRLEKRIKTLKDRLWSRVSVRREAQILRSIDGLGSWTATVLYCEIGRIERFPGSKQLIAFAGLDPVYEESGDQKAKRSISKRGNARIRAVLYTCVEAALRDRSNPPICALYDRLKDKGKPHMVAVVACMRKLLAIIYGCWSKGQRFDPSFERRLKARQSEMKRSGTSDAQPRAVSTDLSAPVSHREVKRRRGAKARQRRGENASPQKSFRSSSRGQDASP